MRSDSSSSSSLNIQPSSTVPVAEDMAYINQYAQPKLPTTAQIKAQGEIKTKMGVLWFVGGICGTLTVCGCISFILSPENAKDVWVIIGPIISSAITGTVAFLTGEKQGSKN